MSSGRAIRVLRAPASLARSLLRVRVPRVAVHNTVRSSWKAQTVCPLAAVRLTAPFSTSLLKHSDEKTAAATNPITDDSPLPDPALDSEHHTREEGHEFKEEHTGDRSLILEEALKLVPEYGWSASVLSEGAKVLGLTGITEEGEMFPRGPGELVDYFEQKCNQSLNEYMEKLANEDQLDGSKLILAAVKYRLEMVAPYIDKWPQAMAIKALPPNIPSSLETLALMVDDIWYMAGDKSTDINWYTKRALLASLYTSTELYMVQDKSRDFLDTWDFLETRIHDIKDVGKIYDDVGKLAKGAIQFVWAGISTARNMAGWNDRQQR